MTDQTKKADQTAEVNLFTDPSCAEQLAEFVRKEGAKITITLAPSFTSDNQIALSAQQEFYPVTKGGFANALGNKLAETLREVIPEILPDLVAATLSQANDVCNCSKCEVADCEARDAEYQPDNDKSEPQEPADSAESSIQ